MTHRIFRLVSSLFLALALTLNGFTPALAAPPANDNFANAEAITSLPFSGSVDITEASLEPDETPWWCGTMEQTVWYSFTPSENMNIRIDMAASAVAGAMSIYKVASPGITGLSIQNCIFTDSSPIIFHVEVGQTYYFQAGAFAGEVGNITLNVNQISTPANDTFANAQLITLLPFSSATDISGAWNELNEPQFQCSPTYMEKTVWYSFTPTETMTVRADSQTGDILSNLSIYRALGPGIENLSFVGCTNYHSLVFTAAANQTYYLQAGVASGQGGNIQINLEQIVPLANDNFADAEAITSLPFTSTVDIAGAGLELDEPQSCFVTDRTVWYSFTPAETIPVRITRGGSTVFSNISVFSSSGPNISDLSLIWCPLNNPAPLTLEAGQTYYIQAGAYPGEIGTIEVNVEQVFPPANDNFANAELVPALPFSATIDIGDAWNEPGEIGQCNSIVKSVWYSFTPTVNMLIGSDTLGGDFDGVVATYLSAGPAISDLVFLGCSNSGSFNFLAEAGKTYYFQVGASYSSFSTIHFNLRELIPPANDNFADAESITSLPFNTSVDKATDATTEPDEQQWCYFMDRTVWYSFTPTETVAVKADTEGSAVDSNMNVYQAVGPGISGLNILTCTAIYGSFTFVAQAGETYYLQAGAISGALGTIQVNLEQVLPPSNDNFADAEAIDSLPASLSVDISGAGLETDEPQNCTNTDKTVWYSFTAPENLSVYLDTQGTAFESTLAIYRSTDSEITSLQFLTCIASSGGVFQAQAGETYYIQAGATLNGLGTYQINLKQVFPPENDLFANALAISSIPFSGTPDLTEAFNEFGEPQVCYQTPNTVWYTFTPSETTKIQIDTENSPLSANVNVYHATGPGFTDLQFIICAGIGGTGAFLAEVGETYYFQVGGFGEDGSVQFNLSEVPTITGRVTDAVTGLPLPGNIEPYADATLYRICGEGCLELVNSQQADSEGRLVFDGYYYGAPLVTGSYQIEARAQFYQTKQFGPFELSGSSLDVGDLPLDPPAVIRGRAVDADAGTPLEGASVTLRRCDGSGCFEFVNSQNTDVDGRFRFNSYYFGSPLQAGTYELEIAAPLHVTRIFEVTINDGEERDLGDVLLDAVPVIDSVSGRLIDAVSGKPISTSFFPRAELLKCDEFGCWTVSSMDTDSQGNFRIETDFNGIRLPAGTYQIAAYADQYEFFQTEVFEVGENVAYNVGDIRLTSYPVRFSDIQPCADIPAAGGACSFSVKITNGTNRILKAKTWSLADSYLPGTFVGSTNFQIKDPQDLDLGIGKSKVVRFRLNVPANNSFESSYVCTRVFVGEGSHALFNTVGFANLFCVYRTPNGFEITTPQEVMSPAQVVASVAETATEVEPNNSCEAAQDVGLVSGPFVMDGVLDSSQSPDVDFFRFSGTPGLPATIDLEGQSTGKGTLGDPYLGFFDSNCNLVAANDDSNSLNSRLEITIPDDGIFVLAATSCCDSGFNGGGNGSYQLTVTPVQLISSISGIITDSLSGNPLSGIEPTFAFVRLQRCEGDNCNDVNFQYAESDGNFHFDTDFSGSPLRVGNYRIAASAEQYQFGQGEIFTVGEGEAYNAGSIGLDSYPIRFSDIGVCNVPAQGGLCDFSVKITNGLPTKFSGRSWSMIDGFDIGSFTNFTSFQADIPRDITLDAGKSMILRFRFQVRGSVANGAVICATAYVGNNPNPFFNTVGLKYLFCFVKGSTGFTLMSEQQMHAHLQQPHKVTPTHKPFGPKK